MDNINNFIAIFFWFLTTLVLTFDWSITGTSNECWTFRFLWSTISIGTFIWRIERTGDRFFSLFNWLYTVSLRTFYWFGIRTSSSCTAFIIRRNTFSVPAMVLIWSANSDYAKVFTSSAAQIRASYGSCWATVYSWTHENWRGALTSWAYNLIVALSWEYLTITGIGDW